MDRREKTFTTIFGPLTLKRTYYHCAVCGHGWCPRDRTLDLAETSLSPAVTRMIGLAASAVSFEEASRLLLELAGLGVDAKCVERAAKELGTAVAQDETVRVAPPPLDAKDTMYADWMARESPCAPPS